MGLGHAGPPDETACFAAPSLNRPATWQALFHSHKVRIHVLCRLGVREVVGRAGDGAAGTPEGDAEHAFEVAARPGGNLVGKCVVPDRWT